MPLAAGCVTQLVVDLAVEPANVTEQLVPEVSPTSAKPTAYRFAGTGMDSSTRKLAVSPTQRSPAAPNATLGGRSNRVAIVAEEDPERLVCPTTRDGVLFRRNGAWYSVERSAAPWSATHRSPGASKAAPPGSQRPDRLVRADRPDTEV